jgi:hypothetical protein
VGLYQALASYLPLLTSCLLDRARTRLDAQAFRNAEDNLQPCGVPSLLLNKNVPKLSLRRKQAFETLAGRERHVPDAETDQAVADICRQFPFTPAAHGIGA